jgi:hypothetical protein
VTFVARLRPARHCAAMDSLPDTLLLLLAGLGALALAAVLARRTARAARNRAEDVADQRARAA